MNIDYIHKTIDYCYFIFIVILYNVLGIWRREKEREIIPSGIAVPIKILALNVSFQPCRVSQAFLCNKFLGK